MALACGPLCGPVAACAELPDPLWTLHWAWPSHARSLMPSAPSLRRHVTPQHPCTAMMPGVLLRISCTVLPFYCPVLPCQVGVSQLELAANADVVITGITLAAGPGAGMCDNKTGALNIALDNRWAHGIVCGAHICVSGGRNNGAAKGVAGNEESECSWRIESVNCMVVCSNVLHGSML